MFADVPATGAVSTVWSLNRQRVSALTKLLESAPPWRLVIATPTVDS
jgi:hypothetical protein